MYEFSSSGEEANLVVTARCYSEKGRCMHKYPEETRYNYMISDINGAVSELPSPRNRWYVAGY